MSDHYILHYILDGHTPVAAGLTEWATWFGTADRSVRKTHIGEVLISTVFLGLDHNFYGGPPLLFETMVFGGPLDQEQDRCSTWDEAVVMHDQMVERVEENCDA